MSRDKDRILEQALKHELRSDAGPMTGDCLDAETLAAWEDGGLDAKAMEAAELHASTCVRCQALLGTMARGVPVVPAEEPKRFRLWAWWLAPIAAATAAVTLWMVVPEQQQLATAPPAREIISEPPAKANSTPPAEGKLEAVQAAPKDRAQTPPAAPFADRDDRRERQVAPPSQSKEEAGKLAEQRVAPSASADTTTSAAAGAPAASARPALPASPAPPAANAMLQKSARLAVAPIEIASPNSTRRWRIVPAGVEFSTDQGASWIPVRANPTETLTNGVSPSGTICWLIGKDGLVLVTADGSVFAKVQLPVRVDVASINATDARSATVTTVDGRTFRTDDSGRNWRQN
jgi:hypothetical protein